jgi:hypothetical protein
MAAVSGGLPRLTEVQTWDTTHLTTAAQVWTDTATRWEDGFSQAARHAFMPDGSPWEGAAATAAQERAIADRTAVGRVADRLRTASADARVGAAEIGAARQQVLAAVSAARAAGFQVGDDLSVTFLDGGSATSGARRAQAESMARDIWQRASRLVTTDRDVAQRISTISGDIQSLSFGGAKEAPPNEMLGVRNAKDVHDVVDPLPPGKQPHVRELPTSAQIRDLYNRLTENAAPAPPSSYPGQSSLLDDGTRISIREASASGGTTVDIRFPDGSQMKVHLPEDGEQQQPSPAPESGFWDTVGGIAIGILGGIQWVAGKAVHPFS